MYKNYIEKMGKNKNDFADGHFMRVECALFDSNLITEDELYKQYINVVHCIRNGQHQRTASIERILPVARSLD